MKELSNFCLVKSRHDLAKRMLSCVDTIILGGGGIKSVAYLGALEEMIRQGLNWDRFGANLRVVAGSSAGSFSAACIGFRLSIEKLNEVLARMDASILFQPTVVDTVV
jgi:predicted acylesterase/phospholipase RssA